MKQYEDSVEKAIDDFMKSPRGANRLNNLYKSKTMAASNSNSSFKKTGVNISKCYQMLCGRCGRRFTSKLGHFCAQEGENHRVVLH